MFLRDLWLIFKRDYATMNYPAASSRVSKTLYAVIPHLMRNPENKAHRLPRFY